MSRKARRKMGSLLRQYRNESGYMSVTHYALKLPVARLIMDRKEEAIPALLEDLRRDRGGMNMITMLEHLCPGADPYTPDPIDGTAFVGYKVDTAMQAWVKWGINNNHIKP